MSSSLTLPESPVACPELHTFYLVLCVNHTSEVLFSKAHSMRCPVMELSVSVNKPSHLIEEGLDSWTHFLQPKE